jgi:hypothetical protein
VFGVLAVCQAMLPLLRKSSDARIVNENRSAVPVFLPAIVRPTRRSAAFLKITPMLKNLNLR